MGFSSGLRGALACLLLLSVACGDDDSMPDGGMDVGPDGGMDGGPDGGTDGGPDGGTDGGPDGGTPSELFPPPTITMCPGDEIPSLAEGTCEVTEGGDATLITADILLPGEVLRGGQVLVDAMGEISCVGCDCSGMGAGATTLVCPDGVLSPGLINAHDHVTFANAVPYDAAGQFTEERYEHRHDWRRGRNMHNEVTAGGGRSRTEQMQWLELRQLMSGTTSINGSGGPEGLLRNLDSNSRNGLDLPAADYSTFPLGGATEGFTLDSGCGYDYADDAGDAAGPGAYAPHVSEGIDMASRNEFLCLREGMHDVVTPNSSFIHGIGLLALDIGEMAVEGTRLIWSPRTNIALYGDTARVTEYAQIGVTISLGTDWLRTGSMNMLRELACADEFNVDRLNGFFPDDQLWLMATRNGAIALGVDSALGTIEVGMRADLAIYNARGRADYRAVVGAEQADVVLVMREGTVLYGDAAVVNALESGCDTFDVCSTGDKAVCLADIGTTYAALEAEAAGEYPLQACDGPPANEPSCLPERNAMGAFPDPVVNGSTRYTGMSTATDPDGDGIDNADDNCPDIFNPVRPLDGGSQADHDSDGIGDACDVCPLGGDEDPTTCNAVDPNDRDNDTIPNDMDNCPSVPNTDQMDRDGDGKGDVCDACPELSNPGGAACPSTVYDVRDGTAAMGSSVALSGLLVTGVGPRGYWIQQDAASDDFDGIEMSGVFVFTGGEPDVARGDLVNITNATVGEFGDNVQLTDSTAMVVSSGNTLADPVVVMPAEIATDGARADALQGVLVRVEDVTVVANDFGFGQFSVTGDLRVDDQMFAVTPLPAPGEELASITGPLNFGFGTTTIEPRDSADVIFASLRVTPNPIRVTLDSEIEIRVSIPDAAPAGGAMVGIAIAAPTVLTGPAVIMIPEGMNQGSAMYTAAATEMDGMLTATYETLMAEVDVSVVEAVGGGLLISEYIEGSGNNKAIELYNGEGSVDLSACRLERFTNGSETVSSMVSLEGTLEAGETHVICNGSFDELDLCDQTSGTINHNGDDAYQLVCDGMLIDSFGRVGEDPGDAWMGGGVSSQNQSLRRDCTVTMGDIISGDEFDPSVEYDAAATIDDFSGLGERGC